MEETLNSSDQNEKVKIEAPQLLALLKEMKDGLDTVRSKVQTLCAKVKENQFPTADGISYLEAKHLLLLSYCQSIVYYLLRKTKGFSIKGHPVVRSLVEIRLFLEKIRPIDKKLEYQVEKLTKGGRSTEEKQNIEKNQQNVAQNTEDLLRYRPNPDLLDSKINKAGKEDDGLYRPPMFAPQAMDEDKMSKLEKRDRRREKENLRQAKRSPYMTEMMNDIEGKPEEVREVVGTESREATRYKEQMEKRMQQEEELFTRAPVSKKDKQKEKHLKKSRNGLLGLTESLFEEIKSLPMEDDGDEHSMGFGNASRGGKKLNKRKRKHSGKMP